jgi:membrane protease YdiL (CAAX protease family)
MNIIKNLKKHEIVIYLIVTFLFTWIFWSISFVFFNQTLNVFFRILGAFMPSVMSMIFNNYFYGRKGIKELLKKLTIWKVNPSFYVFVLFYTVASIYIPVFICTITGVNYKIHINNQLSGFYCSNTLIILAYFLATVFFGGPFGEELGWRGFVLPKLQKKFNSLISSIILGVIWTCWHLPLFFVHAEGFNESFTRYLIETIWLTIIITWLYNNTHGSLLIIILFHGVDNFIWLLCYPDFMNYFNSYTVVFYTMRLIVLLCIIFDMIRKSSNKVESANNYAN